MKITVTHRVTLLQGMNKRRRVHCKDFPIIILIAISVQRTSVRRGHVETSECLVRGASDCQFIVRIIARNRAAVIRRPCNAKPSCAVFL